MIEEAIGKDLKIDKSSWTPVKFGDVVFEPKENAKDIYNEGIEHVVGLEHIDSENIHLTRSGQLEETTTFSKKFTESDVLFGRRRAYLKKAAQAPYSGICSGDITVLRAKDNLIPELLPFIVNNDKFFDYAVKHSAGGLSPRVKFKDLANYEFLLPPKDQQAQLAELLWAMDEVIENEREVLEKIFITKETLRKKYFRLSNANKKVALGEISHLTAGGTPSTNISEYWDKGTIPWLSSGEVHKKIIYSTEKSISEIGLKNSSAKLMPINTCLIALAGQGKTKGTVAITEIELCTNQSVGAILANKDKVEPYYLYHNLDSRYLDFRHITGKENSRTGLNLKILRDFRIAFHDTKSSKQIISELSAIDLNIKDCESKIASSKALQKSIINQIF